MKEQKRICLTCKTNLVYEDFQLECFDCELKFKKKMFNLEKKQQEERKIQARLNKEKNLALRLRNKKNRLTA